MSALELNGDYEEDEEHGYSDEDKEHGYSDEDKEHGYSDEDDYEEDEEHGDSEEEDDVTVGENRLFYELTILDNEEDDVENEEDDDVSNGDISDENPDVGDYIRQYLGVHNERIQIFWRRFCPNVVLLRLDCVLMIFNYYDLPRDLGLIILDNLTLYDLESPPTPSDFSLVMQENNLEF